MDAPVVRTVLVRFRSPHRTPKERAAVVARAEAVFPTIPGVVSFRAGAALDDDWDVLLLVGFEREADVEPYRAHPVHVEFVEAELRPRMEELLARTFRLGPTVGPTGRP